MAFLLVVTMVLVRPVVVVEVVLDSLVLEPELCRLDDWLSSSCPRFLLRTRLEDEELSNDISFIEQKISLYLIRKKIISLKDLAEESLNKKGKAKP